LSDKPRSVAAYNLDELAADAIGLIDAAVVEKAILVGHDWGAAVAWRAANKYPERWSRLVILNVAHPRVMRHQIRSNPAQRRRSWYMFSFQIPYFPEFFMRQNNWRLLVQSMRASSRPGTFTDSDFDLYRKAWSQPGAFTAMLNWYRALFQTRSVRLPSSRIRVPTLMIWGAQDKFVGRELAQPSVDLCDEGRLEFIEQATHWVHHEEPERVNTLMKEFFNP
jgi:pimeloyl-ACP methyl ester carboxylesterase